MDEEYNFAANLDAELCSPCECGSGKDSYQCRCTYESETD